MTKKQIELKLVLEFETTDADIVDISVDGASVSDSSVGTDSEAVSASVVRMIEEFAPPQSAPFQQSFADRCVSELGLDLQPPSGDRKYINAYPPQRYGSKRAVVFDNKSGRAEIYCNPANAEGRENADVVTNNGVPFAVKVYLRSAEAVDQAIELTKIGLTERGA
jgi:hypothetical protein